MGLIKAGMGALGGTLADQWKEFFYCDALPNDVLMRKGEKRVRGRSSNTKGNDNIISNGSGIAVAEDVYKRQIREENVFLFPDGKAWQYFENEVIIADGKVYTEAVFNDVTELYEKRQELKRQSRELKKMYPVSYTHLSCREKV